MIPMNTQIKTSLRRLRNHLGPAFIALAVACSAVSPEALAAPRPTPTPTPTPTPSGEDRRNNNSAAENVDALNINTTGQYMTAHGWHALSANTTGSNNTGSGNVAVGAEALANRTGASYQLQGANTAVGYRSLSYTGAPWGTGSGGDGNTAVGDRSLEYNVDGSFNCAFGLLALSAPNGETDSMENAAIGDRAGYGLRMGIGNVYIGEHETARDPDENYQTYIHNINTTSVSGGFAD